MWQHYHTFGMQSFCDVFAQLFICNGTQTHFHTVLVCKSLLLLNVKFCKTLNQMFCNVQCLFCCCAKQLIFVIAIHTHHCTFTWRNSVCQVPVFQLPKWQVEHTTSHHKSLGDDWVSLVKQDWNCDHHWWKWKHETKSVAFLSSDGRIFLVNLCSTHHQ